MTQCIGAQAVLQHLQNSMPAASAALRPQPGPAAWPRAVQPTGNSQANAWHRTQQQQQQQQLRQQLERQQQQKQEQQRQAQQQQHEEHQQQQQLDHLQRHNMQMQWRHWEHARGEEQRLAAAVAAVTTGACSVRTPPVLEPRPVRAGNDASAQNAAFRRCVSVYGPRPCSNSDM